MPTIDETFVYDSERQVTRHIVGRGSAWETSYDGYGRVSESRDPLGNRATVVYDNAGNPTAQSSYDGTGLLAESTAVYDLLNRQTEVHQWLWEATTPPPSRPASARPLVTHLTYDSASNLKQVQDALGRITQYTYDAAERLVTVADAAGNRQELSLNATGNATEVRSFELDPLGGETLVVATATYDALNRPTQQSDAFPNTTQIVYDARGQVTQATDPEGNVSTFDYNGLNRRTRAERPAGIAVTYEYDKSSRRTAYVDALGNRTTWCAPQKLGRAWVLPVRWAPGEAHTRDEDLREQALPRCSRLLAVGGDVTVEIPAGSATQVHQDRDSSEADPGCNARPTH